MHAPLIRSTRLRIHPEAGPEFSEKVEGLVFLEAATGFEPVNNGFAVRYPTFSLLTYINCTKTFSFLDHSYFLKKDSTSLLTIST